MKPNDILYLIEFLNHKKYIKVPSEKDSEVFLFYYGPSWIPVLCYVVKFLSNSEDEEIDNATLRKTIHLLEESARKWKYLNKWNKRNQMLMWNLAYEKEQEEKTKQLVMKIVLQEFLPQVRKYFEVPIKMPSVQLLNQNETLAAFLEFLLQSWNTEAHRDNDDDDKDMPGLLHKNESYALVHKELKYVLTYLGDLPFQCGPTHLDLLNPLLAKFGILANQIGHFTFCYILSPHPNNLAEFDARLDDLLQSIELLNANIKQYCITFSESVPSSVTATTPRVTRPIDSLFIVNSLLVDLESLINQRLHITIDVDILDQIRALFEVLKLSSIFLKDAKLVHRETMDDCVIAIREIAYEAEYLINSYAVGYIHVWYLRLRLPSVIQKLKLNHSRLREISSNNDVLQVTQCFTRNVSLRRPRETATTVVEDHLVGIQKSKIEILDKLTGGPKALKTISLVGMPGLGKTTLAKILFDSSSVRRHFDRRAWCVISQKYQKRKVFLDILSTLASTGEEKASFLAMDNECLGLKIFQGLKGNRYIIVVDDVWIPSTWDEIRRYFPDDNNRSRIVFTSRNKDATPSESIFPALPLLSEVDSLNLLVKKVFLNEPCPPQLLGIGNRIAKGCNGLPLAVAAIAGILANLDKDESTWEKVEMDLDTFILNNDQVGCIKLLEFSYKYLPDYLKMCFLYLGKFGEEIYVSGILRLLIAEGLVEEVKEKSPEDVANEYLHDLINRSLVLIKKRKFDGSIKKVGVHDLLCDWCLRKADEENLMKSTKEPFSRYMRHHRIRSDIQLSLFFRAECHSLLGQVLTLTSRIPKMLHHWVIDMSPVISFHDEEQIRDGIDMLVHLRYLSAPEHVLLPELASNLVNLEVLDIKTISGSGISLSIILKMVKLKHLKIKSETRITDDSCDSSQTTNLQSLSGIKISNNLNDEKILNSCPNLQNLKCICDESQFPDVSSLAKLETLRMKYDNTLGNIDLTKVIFPLTIKKLTLDGIGLPWYEASIIGKLPNLAVLNLIDGAFVGEEWKTIDGEFWKLRFLKLEKIKDLMQWITRSGHFPELQCLVLKDCYSLQDIPSDLGNIPTLQKVEVDRCSYTISKYAVQIEQEQHENGNKELEVRISSPHWSKNTLVQEYREMKEVFRLLNEGCITSSSDLLSVMRPIGMNPSEADLQRMINEVNGNIDFPEFLDLIDQIRFPYSDYELQKAFQFFVFVNKEFVNAHDLYYGLSELGHMVTRKEAEKMVREADIDGDRKLNQHEFNKLMMTIDVHKPNDLRKVLLLRQQKEEEENDGIQVLKNDFNSFDFDGDGCITRNELSKLILHIEENTTDAQLQNMITKVDLHGNGTIDFPYFLYLHAITFREEVFKEQFKFYDEDQNGFISAAELLDLILTEDGMEMTDDEKEKLIRESDVDGDGQLDFHDYVKFVNELYLKSSSMLTQKNVINSKFG